eukprot:6700598-Heterocapsa_arctica.AAC.1
MAFIPKGTDGIISSFEAKPPDLRPLTLSNSDQQLLSLGLDFPLVQMCQNAHSAQRGFIEGRILTDN